MFAAIDAFTNTGERIVVKINPFHVSRFAMSNPKDVEHGTILFMKDGNEIFTPLPMDEVDTRFIMVADRFAANIMVQTAAYYAKEIEEEINEEAEETDTK